MRLYIEASSLEIARKVLEVIIEKAGKIGVVKNTKYEDYWKIKEYKKLEFELDVSKNFSLQQVGSIFGNGWDLITPEELIWETGENKIFCVESVRWAHIEALAGYST